MVESVSSGFREYISTFRETTSLKYVYCENTEWNKKYPSVYVTFTNANIVHKDRYHSDDYDVLLKQMCQNLKKMSNTIPRQIKYMNIFLWLC